MRLRSSAFPDGTTIPRRFTCDGTDLSPPLDWSDAPETTRSFVLLCDDPDAPAGTWRHWAAYDIPADRAALVEGAAQQGKGFKQAINDFQQPGYGGPCPPRGDGIHRYRFRLLALAVDRLPARREPSCQAVEREANKHLLAEATLIGTYQR
ncbi:MAG: YbhB/YbcL family Raf kinase inhibitor-like protein [Xanthobacteraceae bacterium]|jgi:Raf kinase inhibitor-like YbhB/YbcL family protein